MPDKIDNVLVWGIDGIEQATIEQAARSARLPFVSGHVALMPDAHVGKGATIGSVIPTVGAVMPSAVGVDIGCGMIAARLDLDAVQLPDDLGGMHRAIRDAIPAGMGKGHAASARDAARDAAVDRLMARAPFALSDQRKTAAATTQFGSLGSGNHFVELCLDDTGRVWLVLHSGSRGVGNQLATEHIEKAKGLMARYAVALDDPDLAYFTEGTAEFERYIAAMLWAQDWAMANRAQMLQSAVGAVARELRRPVRVVDEVNCHHNFTERERHHGREMWITRKGAIRVRKGDRGVIPGSMGTRSYVVSGLGNAASYCSCSHGAGRRMSRSAARRTLDVDGLRERMAGKAWNHRDAEALIDEDPRSYKDIDDVMAAQADLVTVETTLHQVLNYKGAEDHRRAGARRRRT